MTARISVHLNTALAALLLLGLISIVMNVYSNVIFEYLKRFEYLPNEETKWTLRRALWWIGIPLILLPISYALLTNISGSDTSGASNATSASIASPTAKLEPTNIIKPTLASSDTTETSYPP